MEAVVALNDIADLTGLQLNDRAFKLRHHLPRRIDISGGIVLTAGVFAVLVRQLVKQGHRVLRGPQLLQQVLRQFVFFHGLVRREDLSRLHILRGEQDVVGVVGVVVVVLLREVQVAPLGEHLVHQIRVQVGVGRDSVEVLPAQSQHFYVVENSLLAAHLRHGVLEIGIQGLAVRLAQGDALFRSQLLNGHIILDGGLNLGLGVLQKGNIRVLRRPVNGHGLAVHTVAVHAVVAVVAQDIILKSAAHIAIPVEI